MIGNVFKYLTSEKGKITDDYMRLQLVKLDKLDGNVDSLSNRIANVRTWSYVSNKNNWVENQSYWIEKTKHLEDRLSDRFCLLYTSPSPRDATLSRMPSSA